MILFNDPDGNRTRVTAVKGRCLNRLTTGPYPCAVRTSYKNPENKYSGSSPSRV